MAQFCLSKLLQSNGVATRYATKQRNYPLLKQLCVIWKAIWVHSTNIIKVNKRYLYCWMWSGWWWQIKNLQQAWYVTKLTQTSKDTKSTLQLAIEKRLQFMPPLPMFSFQPGLQPRVRCSGWDASAGEQRTPPRNGGDKLSRWTCRLTQAAFGCQSRTWSGE